jgi:hypothetical protein
MSTKSGLAARLFCYGAHLRKVIHYRLSLRIPTTATKAPAAVMLDLASAQLSYEQLLELVSQLLAGNELLRAGIEHLSRKESWSAAPFSKNKRKKNPKRPGHKPGQGPFNNRPAPPEEAYSALPVDAPVS